MAYGTISAIDDFPLEGALVGKLLLSYGELEWALCLCLSSVLDDEEEEGRHNRAARVFYRARGEEYRIIVADALMRPKFQAAKLEPPYSEFIADLGYCKTIRNQYAHCHWFRRDGEALHHFTFEDGAKKNGEFVMQMHPVTPDLLQKQLDFFVFTYSGLMLLYRHYEHRVGRDTSQLFPFPKKMDRPPLHNPSS